METGRITSLIYHPNSAVLFRLFVGATFVLAAVSKLPHHTEFEGIVQDYDILPDTLAEVYANALPWVELLVGVYLLLGILVRPGALVTLLLGISFLIANTSALIDGDSKCGSCFGDTFTLPLWLAFTLDTLLLGAAALLLKLGDRSSVNLARLLVRTQSTI